MNPLFNLGYITATPRSLSTLEDAGILPQALLLRHQTGDWGDLDNEDKSTNDRSVNTGGRILSSYKVKPGVPVWVITEWDRSSTTILLPSEY
jgi:hypothetical protein